MRIAIIDDDSEARRTMRAQVHRYLSERHFQAELIEFCSGADFLAAARGNNFHLAFLDIYMQGMDGVRTAEQLREFDAACCLIFTTASREHALDGYRVHARGYLLKPFTEQDVSRVLDDCLTMLPLQPERFITVRAERTDVKLLLRHIHYAVTQNHYLYIHTEQGVIRTYLAFSEFCRMLAGEKHFLVCNRGVLVNMDAVTALEENCFRMRDGQTLPIRLSTRSKVKQMFFDYLFQRMRER